MSLAPRSNESLFTDSFSEAPVRSKLQLGVSISLETKKIIKGDSFDPEKVMAAAFRKRTFLLHYSDDNGSTSARYRNSQVV